MDGKQLKEILNQTDSKYDNNPELIKMLLEYRGKEGHQKIHTDLLKELIDKYVKLNQELEKKVEEITKLSETDQLTQIYNRVKFVKELEKEISRVERYESSLSLIMFDIDHFKQVNDNYGHDVGDQVLIEIAAIVGDSIRDADIFARWGGEEFMVLTPNTELGAAIELAQRLRENIAQTEFDQVGQVTCSFGVAEFSEDDDFDRFTKRVDEALYRAKETGRNRVVDYKSELK